MTDHREYLRTYRRERWNLRSAERYDVLEGPPPKRGCNVKDGAGKRCGRRVVLVRGGFFSGRRLCDQHDLLYFTHDRILQRILAIPPRAI